YGRNPMKKWIIIVTSLLVIIIGSSIYIYSSARQPYKEAEQTAMKRAKAETDIVEIEDFYLYNGTDTYYVMIGHTKEKEKLVAWIPEKKDEKIITKQWSKGISEDEAIAKLLAEE